MTLAVVIAAWAGRALAGGGMILSNDVCIVTIGFYTAHFTGYQPQTRGNLEFCSAFPDKGETIMVFDYLHNSLSQVPVDFRIIRDVLGKGEFVQMEDVETIDNVDELTVFYQPPIIRENASLQISYDFETGGNYLGIITAGHPSNDKIYSAVFPFSVAVRKIPWPIISLIVAILIAGAYLGRMLRGGKKKIA